MSFPNGTLCGLRIVSSADPMLGISIFIYFFWHCHPDIAFLNGESGSQRQLTSPGPGGHRPHYISVLSSDHSLLIPLGQFLTHTCAKEIFAEKGIPPVCSVWSLGLVYILNTSAEPLLMSVLQGTLQVSLKLPGLSCFAAKFLAFLLLDNCSVLPLW